MQEDVPKVKFYIIWKKSLGKKNSWALEALALQYIHKEVTTGKDGYCF